MRKVFFFGCLALIFSLHAKKGVFRGELEVSGKTEVQSPWLTGPLLAPSGTTIPPGHFNIEPYIYIIANTGRYNKDWKPVKKETFWNNVFQPSCQFGLTEWLDFQLNPTLIYNYTRGAGKWVIGDMPIGFDIQLYRSVGEVTDWTTGVKLGIKEVIPMGKYQKLDPKKLGTDIGGGGTWQTGVGLVWGNLFYLGKGHFFDLRVGAIYNLPAPVHVKKLNTYGGGRRTKGTVYPAQIFQFDIGSELTLTKRWVLALDIVGSWTGRARFKGKTVIPVTSPSAVQFSLAPAIEYNWNANLGMIFGPWFTVAGRNSPKFTGGVFAFNYYN